MFGYRRNFLLLVFLFLILVAFAAVNRSVSPSTAISVVSCLSFVFFLSFIHTLDPNLFFKKFMGCDGFFFRSSPGVYSGYWMEWTFVLGALGTLIIVDFMFMDSSNFVFDPNPNNWNKEHQD